MSNTHSTLTSLFEDIANAIRAKTGSTDTIVADEFPSAIEGIEAGAGSPNGTEWFPTSVTSGHVSEIREGNGMIVARINAYPYYSSDFGKTWTANTDTSLSSVCYGGGIWVGCKNGKGMCYSTDGKTWAQSNITSNYFSGLCYAHGLWCVSNTDVGGIYYSTDGKTWTKSSNTTSKIGYMSYGAGVWVAADTYGGGLWYSTDGKSWTASNFKTTSAAKPLYANGIWVSEHSSSLCYSTDGKTWTYGKGGGNVRIGGLDNANGVWVVTSLDNRGLLYSEDGIQWTQSNITSGNWSTVAYSCGVWITGSHEDAGIYYSVDGKTWYPSKNVQNGSWASLCNANGIWLAGFGYAQATRLGIMYSPTWELS